jgi:hypothetical protein
MLDINILMFVNGCSINYINAAPIAGPIIGGIA